LTFDTFIRYGSLWTLVLGVFSLLFAIRSYRRQVNAQIFFEIAKRYHDMLERFPIQDWTLRMHPKEKLPEPTAELQSGALRYFAMVHFAFVLHELGYLSKKLWRILQLEHRRTLTSPLFIREWCGVRREFNLFPKFVSYIDSLQTEATVIDPNLLETEEADLGLLKKPFSRRIWRRPQRLERRSTNCGSSD
jgi:hypothetical protein